MIQRTAAACMHDIVYTCIEGGGINSVPCRVAALSTVPSNKQSQDSFHWLVSTPRAIVKKTLVEMFILCCSLEIALCSTRADRVWPLSNAATIDLGQSSPFGPRLQASKNFIITNFHTYIIMHDQLYYNIIIYVLTT